MVPAGLSVVTVNHIRIVHWLSISLLRHCLRCARITLLLQCNRYVQINMRIRSKWICSRVNWTTAGRIECMRFISTPPPSPPAQSIIFNILYYIMHIIGLWLWSAHKHHPAKLKLLVDDKLWYDISISNVPVKHTLPNIHCSKTNFFSLRLKFNNSARLYRLVFSLSRYG